MSVATDFSAVVRRRRAVRPSATVVAFHAPPAHPQRPAMVGHHSCSRAGTISVPPPAVRKRQTPYRLAQLTPRGVAVIAASAVLVAAALVLVAWLSAPSRTASGGAHGSGATVPGTVAVRVGDSLWSIARRVAPQRDPRGVVADLERINALSGSAIHAGQTLRTP